MQIDDQFDPTEDDPPVPDKLLDRTLKYMSSLVRVDVERKRGANSWKKINGFKLDSRNNGEPADDAEEVAGMIVMIAASHVEETGDEGSYRAKYHVTGRTGKVDRKTFAFRMTADSDEPEAIMDDLEKQEVLAVAFDRAIALIEIQNRHIDVQNARILEQAQVQSGQTAPLLATIETLVNKYHEGLNMQATALQALFDNERSLKVEETKAERDKALIDILALAAPKAFDQFGEYVKGRTQSGGSTKAKTDTTAETVEVEATETIPTDPKAPEGEPAQEMVLENPLTVFAHAFRESIHSQQWMDLSESLTKPQMKALKEATTQEEDDATAEGIMVFKECLKPTQFLRLQRILDEQQQKMIGRLLELIEQYEPEGEPAEGEEGDDDEGEPEEE